MKKWLFFIVLVFFQGNIFALHQKYTFDLYELTFHLDNQYIFYNKEVTIRSIISGNYHVKSDSIILTTHKGENTDAIFMIFKKSEDDLVLNQIYIQKDFISKKIELPKLLYLKATYYEDNQIFEQYVWQNKKNLSYDVYAFSPQQNPKSIARFKNNLLEGEQVSFFNEKEIAPQTLKYFSQGEKVGTWVYLKKVKGQLLVYKTEKYKKGKLRKTKKFIK